MSTRKQFDQVRDEIKQYLPQYLAKFGIDAREKKKFRCILPSHQDTHPSAGVIPSNPELFHCFACGFTGDIFDAANAKENKSLTGRGFITDNMMYLAKMFHVTMPDLNISDEEMFEIDARRAYAHAARIITQSKRSEIVAEKLKAYMWPDEILFKIGVGSIESYDDYIHKMTRVHGHSMEFLEKIDLTRKGLFRNSNLIYTVRDEHGSPIAFSARNLKYEAEEAKFRARKAEIKALNLPEKEEEAKIAELYKPTKYVNSKETILFAKGKILFNFDQAKKSTTKSLLVFEGNADAVTLFAGGVKTAVATCGTSFTTDHLELALANEISKIVLVYDADAAGEKGTQRFVDMLEQFGGRPGLEVEIISMPAGTDDPDAYVRAFGDLKTGVAEFRKLPRVDLISWKLKRSIEEGADPYGIVKDTLPHIVNIENNIDRFQRADRLADVTGVSREFIHLELLRMLDGQEAELEGQRISIAQQASKALAQNPGALEAILANAQVKLATIETSKVAYDPRLNLSSLQGTVEKLEIASDMFELVTGYPIFDSLMGGIPKEGAMISLPGKPHHGKSIWLDNLVVNMLRHNPNVQIFLHHVDDGSLLRIPRLLGVMSGLSSRDISKAGAAMATLGAEFETKFRAAEAEITGWVRDERLILADTARLAGDLTAHERWIKEIRRRHPKRNLVAIGDNFHLFDLPGMEPGEGKVREMSKFVANLPTKHGITSMFTMELPKDILRPGVRPKYTDSKNSGGIAFDSKVNMCIFQELQDLGTKSILTWTTERYKSDMVPPDETVRDRVEALPIIEVIVDKNKVTGRKKTVLFKLEPRSGQMTECSVAEHCNYWVRDRVTQSRRA